MDKFKEISQILGYQQMKKIFFLKAGTKHFLFNR